jgi:hypothetical protein
MWVINFVYVEFYTRCSFYSFWKSGGLDIRKYVDRFTSILMIEGKGEQTSPAVCNEKGESMERWRLNNKLHDVMEKVQSLENDVVPLDIEVRECFNIH